MFSDQIKFESKMSSTFLFVEMVKDGLIMTELDVRSKVEMNIGLRVGIKARYKWKCCELIVKTNKTLRKERLRTRIST